MVSVRKFDPRNVVCTPKTFQRDSLVLKACEAILDQMNTSKDVEFFTQQDLHEPDIEVPLPYTYVAPATGSTKSPPSFKDQGTEKESQSAEMYTQSYGPFTQAIWQLVPDLGGCGCHYCTLREEGKGRLLGGAW